jgi:hypothetical protein
VKKSWIVALLCAFVALPLAAQSVVAEKGKLLTAANGARLGVVSRVAPDGSAQVIIDGRMVTVPVNTLSVADGKLTTNLTKSQVLALH